jgi:hypothetical protein
MAAQASVSATPARTLAQPDSDRRGLKGARERPVGPIRLTAAKTTTPLRARNPPRTPALTDAGMFAKQPPNQALARSDGTPCRRARATGTRYLAGF